MSTTVRFQQILGIRFLVGTADDAIDQVSSNGGLVVVPAAPALKNLAHDKRYRDALLGADFAIADSALMVILWNLIQRDRIPKLSVPHPGRQLLGDAQPRRSRSQRSLASQKRHSSHRRRRLPRSHVRPQP
jgi:hypothetical protein